MIRLVDVVADPAAAWAAALDEFRSGGLVVLPTETVYGLAVLPSGPRAVDVMFRRKGRADDRPVAVLVADVDQARTLVEPGPAFELLAASFWPGPLTVVTTRGVGFSARLRGDQVTVGVRCPDHELVRALAAEVGPLAVTSANRSGGMSRPAATLSRKDHTSSGPSGPPNDTRRMASNASGIALTNRP